MGTLIQYSKQEIKENSIRSSSLGIKETLIHSSMMLRLNYDVANNTKYHKCSPVLVTYFFMAASVVIAGSQLCQNSPPGSLALGAISLAALPEQSTSFWQPRTQKTKKI